MEIDVFFFNDTATTEIYTLSLHDALPIYSASATTMPIAYPLNANTAPIYNQVFNAIRAAFPNPADRKSTRLNSSHANISYAVFCLKKTQHLLLYVISFVLPRPSRVILFVA